MLAKVVDFDSSDDEDDGGSPNCTTILKTMLENKQTQIWAEVLYLAHYLQQFKAKFENGCNLTDTFRELYLEYVHLAIRKCTKKYKLMAKAEKLITILIMFTVFLAVIFTLTKYTYKLILSRFTEKIREFIEISSQRPAELVSKAQLKTEFDTVRNFLNIGKTEREVLKPAELLQKLDLAHFRKHVDDELSKYTAMNHLEFTYADYKIYVMYVIVRITMFNLRRSSQVASMSTVQFSKRAKAKGQDFPYDKMTEGQKSFAKEIRVVSLRGEYFMCNSVKQVNAVMTKNCTFFGLVYRQK